MNVSHPRRSPYPAAETAAGLEIPVLVTYLHPFRVIPQTNTEKWGPTIEEVSRRTWDYVRLHELVGGIDVGLESPAHMVVGFDGALMLPLMPQFKRIENAVEFFNRHLAAILLGGTYCESIGLEDVDQGRILDWRYLRVAGRGSGSVNQFHFSARLQLTSALHATALVSPRHLSHPELVQAHAKGIKILEQLPELSPEFLLRGVSAMARREWSAVLSNIWINVEQVTAHLWEREMLNPKGSDISISGRQKQLSDVRTWTTAHRQEMLFQRGTIDADTMAALFTARQARNNLVHRGQPPTETAARAAFAAFRGLLERSTMRASVELFEIDLQDHALIAPFEMIEIGKPTHWMSIPQLPGEDEINKRVREYRTSQAQRRQSDV